ncbi:hypothetical protein ACHAXA_000563 [Cyclostephanos tholiformis]|uniref:Mercuric reductase n=1 Tax=Cyclostephanos tholiformis TaxID=382380 RepID=A0ABD3SSU2_9STRA
MLFEWMSHSMSGEVLPRMGSDTCDHIRADNRNRRLSLPSTATKDDDDEDVFVSRTTTTMKLGVDDGDQDEDVLADDHDAPTSSSPSSSPSSMWRPLPHATPDDTNLASSLSIWPLDVNNANLLNEVRHRDYVNPLPLSRYDMVVIGAGAGGLVSSRQAARRGAKSCMISAELAGGDCLNAGCVPSKALLRCAKLIREVRKATARDNEYGIRLRGVGRQRRGDGGNEREHDHDENEDESENDDVEVSVDFPRIMERMRKLRSNIAPVDGHARGSSIGTQIFQGRGTFISHDKIEVIEYGKESGDKSNPILSFDNAVIATGGRPRVPSDIPGLLDAPYTTNVDLFNLQVLPPRMVVLGSGVVAMEMAQAFATFGSNVTVVSTGKSGKLLSGADDDAVHALRGALEDDGITFVTGAKVLEIMTLRRGGRSSPPIQEMTSTTTTTTTTTTTKTGGSGDGDSQLPLMKISLATMTRNGDDVVHSESRIIDLECECLLVAMGRVANVDSLGLDFVNVKYDPVNGILVDEYSKSISNPNVYAVGDCVAYVPRLTHVSGEMAKVVVQNSLFGGRWKLSSLVVPAVMYTDPEYALVRRGSIFVDENGHVVPRTKETARDEDDGNDDKTDSLDVYKAELRHNDRAILDGTDVDGFVKIRCLRGTGTIVDCTIVSTRAGEMINEVALAIKSGIDMEGLGRNVHSYPTLGEAVMSCGLQYINSRWITMGE